MSWSSSVNGMTSSAAPPAAPSSAGSGAASRDIRLLRASNTAYAPPATFSIGMHRHDWTRMPRAASTLASHSGWVAASARTMVPVRAT